MIGVRYVITDPPPGVLSFIRRRGVAVEPLPEPKAAPAAPDNAPQPKAAGRSTARKSKEA